MYSTLSSTFPICRFEMKNAILHFTCFIFFTLYSGIKLSAQDTATNKAHSGSFTLAKKILSISSKSKWKQIAATPLQFNTYHTQGITKANGFFYMTAVKVIRWPKRYENITNGFDRDNGEGAGYLFKFDSGGKLIDSIQLGEGVIYHPGGIDYDGKYIWVPVCEYRPHGKSLIYRVDPKTMSKTLMAECDDALGAIAYERDAHILVGMNWGSREFYTWKVIHQQNTSELHAISSQGITNPHYYIDYQDCNYIGSGLMLCGGLNTYKDSIRNSSFRLGGIDVVDMNKFYARLSLPVSEWSDRGAVMTNNPCFVELVNGKLRFYFVPDDDRSVLYTYELE